jgi:hypothetical protein
LAVLSDIGAFPVAVALAGDTTPPVPIDMTMDIEVVNEVDIEVDIGSRLPPIVDMEESTEDESDGTTEDGGMFVDVTVPDDIDVPIAEDVPVEVSSMSTVVGAVDVVTAEE